MCCYGGLWRFIAEMRSLLGIDVSVALPAGRWACLPVVAGGNILWNLNSCNFHSVLGTILLKEKHPHSSSHCACDKKIVTFYFNLIMYTFSCILSRYF